MLCQILVNTFVVFTIIIIQIVPVDLLLVLIIYVAT